MIIIWEVNDGYAGMSRPHRIEICDDELNDLDTEEERNSYIDECVQEDFNDKVYFYWRIEKC